MKKCSKCLESKNEILFSKKRWKLNTVCKKCVSIYYAKWAKENREKHNSNVRKYKQKNKLKISAKLYNIDENILTEILNISWWRCMICKEERKLHIDHNHTTWKVRWMLCQNCNRWIWMFYDNINILNNAIKYIHNSQ